MKADNTQIQLKTLSEIPLDADAETMAEQLMREDGETELLRFLAAVIDSEESRLHRK